MMVLNSFWHDQQVVVTTDASSTGWGATCNGQAASGLWTGTRLPCHINCLELLAVHLALRQFQATAVRQACIGSYGQHCGYLVHQPVGRSAWYAVRLIK